MFKSFKVFCGQTDGAVTADWVVLAAATVGLGLTSVVAVRGGVGNLSGSIRTALDSASVAAICQSDYAMRVFTGDSASKADDIAHEISNLSDEELANNHLEVAAKVENLIANREDQRHIDENMDYLALYEAEVNRRGLRTDERTPSLASLAGVSGACGDGVSGGAGFDYAYNFYDPERDAETLANIAREFANFNNEELADAIRKVEHKLSNAFVEGSFNDAAALLDTFYLVVQEVGNRGDPEAIAEVQSRFERAQRDYERARADRE